MSAPVAMTDDDHFARACVERDRADEWARRADDLSKKLEAAEAARDEAERRLAVVEEAARQAVTDLNFAAATRSIMLVDRAIDDLNAVIHTEKQP